VYIIILKQRASRSLSGPLSSLAAGMLTVVPCSFQIREDFYEFHPKTIESPELWLNMCYNSFQFLYLLTLILKNKAEKFEKQQFSNSLFHL
jgi:hypothetical protein